jgi:hypothetical protein
MTPPFLVHSCCQNQIQKIKNDPNLKLDFIGLKLKTVPIDKKAKFKK